MLLLVSPCWRDFHCPAGRREIPGAHLVAASQWLAGPWCQKANSREGLLEAASAVKGARRAARIGGKKFLFHGTIIRPTRAAWGMWEGVVKVGTEAASLAGGRPGLEQPPRGRLHPDRQVGPRGAQCD